MVRRTTNKARWNRGQIERTWMTQIWLFTTIASLSSFSRINLLLKTGIWSFMKKRGKMLSQHRLPSSSSASPSSPAHPSVAPAFVVGSTHVQYRRSLDFMMRYTLTGRIVSWDDRNFFFEHQYQARAEDTPNSSAPIVYAVVLVRVTAIGEWTIPDILAELNQPNNPPPLPNYWKAFLDTTEECRQQFKSGKETNKPTQSIQAKL